MDDKVAGESPQESAKEKTARELRWSIAIRAMREKEEAKRRANAAAFPWYDAPGSNPPKAKMQFDRLPEKLQVGILSYLAPDLHVALRNKGDGQVIVIVNIAEWREYLPLSSVSRIFRQRVFKAFWMERISKRIAIVLDTRNSVRDDINALAASEPSQGTECPSAAYLEQYLAMKFTSPYHVGGLTILFTAKVTRASDGAPAKPLKDFVWEILEGDSQIELSALLAGVRGRIQQAVATADIFDHYWTSAALGYLHDVIVSTAISHAIDGEEG